MKPYHALGITAAAVIAATQVAAAQDLGTPGDGTMSYARPTIVGSGSGTPADGIIDYTRLTAIQVAQSSVTTNEAPLEILNAHFVSAVPEGSIDNYAALWFSFENTAHVSATDVRFGVYAGGESIATRDFHGSFAPGVAINRQVITMPRAFAPVVVSVDEIHYADGSTWTKSETSPTLRQATQG